MAVNISRCSRCLSIHASQWRMPTALGFSLGVADPKISQPTKPHISRPKKRMLVDYNVVNNMMRSGPIEESPHWNNTADDVSGGFIRWGFSTPPAAPENAADESDVEPQYSMVCEKPSYHLHRRQPTGCCDCSIPAVSRQYYSTGSSPAYDTHQHYPTTLS